MKAKWDVVVVGGANTDYTTIASKLPTPGETVTAGEFLKFEAGGKGANQAVAAARLGARVAFVGRVGNDARGRDLLRCLRAEGINTKHVSIDSHRPTGAALIHVDEEGEKQIVAAPEANGRLSTADIREASELIQRARVLVLQLEVPMAANLAAARLAKKAGVSVMLDAAPAAKPPAELLRLLSVVRANSTEAKALTGVTADSRRSARLAAQKLLSRGIKIVILQAGGEGNLIVSKDSDGGEHEFSLKKIPVKSVDATGAGDGFVGAFAVALVEGRALEEAGLFANAAAALTTTKFGAQPALPNRREVTALLRRSRTDFSL